jgi:hypothetical protein
MDMVQGPASDIPPGVSRTNARVFEEPLAPASGPSSMEENQALASRPVGPGRTYRSGRERTPRQYATV